MTVTARHPADVLRATRGKAELVHGEVVAVYGRGMTGEAEPAVPG